MWIERDRGRDPVMPGSRTVDLCTLSGGLVARRLRILNRWHADGDILHSEFEVLPGSDFAGFRVETAESLAVATPLQVRVHVPGASRSFAPGSSFQRIFASEISYEHLRFFLPDPPPVGPASPASSDRSARDTPAAMGRYGDAILRRTHLPEGAGVHAYLPPSCRPAFTTWTAPDGRTTDVQYAGEILVAGLPMPTLLTALSAAGQASVLQLREPAPTTDPTAVLIQRVHVGATPRQVFATFTDPAAHAAVTGVACRATEDPALRIVDEGNIQLRLVCAEAPRLLHFGWQMPAAGGTVHACTLRIAPTDGGSTITFLHTGIPAAAGELVQAGWMRYYWQPLGLTRIALDELTAL